MRRVGWSGLAVGVLASLSACSSTPDAIAVDQTVPAEPADSTPDSSVATSAVAPTPPASRPTTTEAAEIDETALLYFEDIAKRVVSEHAEPGSAAELYSLYLSDLVSVFGRDIGTVEVVDGDVEITFSSVALTETVQFSDIEVSPDGVRTFDIDELELDTRIATSFDTQESNGVELQRVISYQSIDGAHIVLATITNTTDIDFYALGPPSFVDSSRSQRDSTHYLQNNEVKPGATAIVGIEFPGGSTAAGTIYIDGATAESFPTFAADATSDVSFVVEVREPGS